MRDYVMSLEPTFDYMCVSSEWERDLIRDFGVPNRKIKITGLPRFDSYSPVRENSIDHPSKIVIALTWQDALIYQAKQNEILSVCEQLRDAGFDISVDIERHPMLEMDKRSKSKLAKQKDSSNLGIANCDLLITDDSSIAWDVFYNKSEVLFYKAADDWLVDFDYLVQRRCETQEGLYKLLSTVLSGTNHFVCVPQFTKHCDQQNSKRVLDLSRDQ
jgi:CDP-glycerol glycerophosphotransferase (TagB/SpsB family)